MLQRGELSCGVFAGEWKSEEESLYKSPPAKGVLPSGLGGSPKIGWEYETSALASSRGCSSLVVARVWVDTDKSREIQQSSAEAVPPPAWARGSLKKVHGTPAHAQGIPLGIYRASAEFEIYLQANCTAEGPTASVTGGGSANASCGVGTAANVSLGQLDIGCDSKESKEWGFNLTLPGGVGAGFNGYKSEIGRTDKTIRSSYLYMIPDTKTSFSTLEFVWKCDADAHIEAFATPTNLASKSGGTIYLRSTVGNLNFEVIHADTRSNSDSESN